MESFSGTFIRETDKAICLKTDDGVDHWIPKSVIEDLGEYVEGESVDIEVPSWFFEKAGLY